MNLTSLKQSVYTANMALQKSGLVLFTFGNVSGIDRTQGVVVIKPSGVDYDKLTPDAMVAVSLDTGEVIDSSLRPSSDTPTHLELYRAFPSCGGVVHTHSEYATACAHARRPIRCMGTTHADYFRGDIPVTREMTQAETVKEYEKNTGLVITELFGAIDPVEVQAVLVANHGPFVWGSTPDDAVHNAVIVEFLAKLEVHVAALDQSARPPAAHLIKKHYYRKHGAGAYYGQK